MFSWYKYLIVSLVFSHLGFWSGSLFLIAPFPDLCLLVLFLCFNFRLLSCRITIPESWARYTQENIARSQKERAASERLRGEIDSCLRACANDMWNMFNTVNNAFNARIRETTDARNKLQAHLQRVRFPVLLFFCKHSVIC